MKFTRVFWNIYDAWADHARYIDSEGGARSSKTTSALQFLVLLAKSDKTPTITSVVSETFPQLRRGAVRDFKEILGQAFDENTWNKSDCIYTFPNGSIIEFFSADQAGKVRGPKRHRLFVNEANRIDWETFLQLDIRTTDFVIIDYNPTHEFWAMTQILPRKECRFIHSTYKDNPFLPPEQIKAIEANRDNKNWWQVYGEGKVGTLEGTIYTFEQIDEMPEAGGLRECYGMDFGFSNDPTAIVHVLADTGRKIAYLDERCYRTQMLNSDIIDFLRADGVPRTVEIYADCAEPKSIAEIERAGFRLIPCDKDAPARSEKRVFQIQWVQGWKLMVTKTSLNLIKELRNYTWVKDGDGKATNRPIDGFDHLCDAFRYALWTKFADGEGDYVIGFRNKPIPRPAVQKKRYTTERLYAHKQRNHR